jgi:hypothetical protein
MSPQHKIPRAIKNNLVLQLPSIEDLNGYSTFISEYKQHIQKPTLQ